MGLIEPAVLVVDPIHAQEYGFLHMARGAELCQQVVEIFLIGFARLFRSKLVLPQEKAKQRTLEHLRRDVAAVVSVRQRSQMDVAIDQGFASRYS